MARSVTRTRAAADHEYIAYQAVDLEHPDRNESVVVLLNVADQAHHFDLDLPVREVLVTSNPGSPQAFPIDGARMGGARLPGTIALNCADGGLLARLPGQG